MLSHMEREALKVGDLVGVYERYRAAVLKVTKRTKTQIVLSDGSRWTVGRGYKVGASTWSYDSLVSEKDARERIVELKEASEIAGAANRLREVTWRELTLPQLNKFIALLDEIEAPLKLHDGIRRL